LETHPDQIAAISHNPAQALSTKQESLWRPYKTAHARDLAWIFFSPPLVNEHPNFPALSLVKDTNKTTAWLNSIDTSGNSNIPRRETYTRLGLYFEALLSYIFEQKRRLDFIKFELISQHIQIIENKQTLGEVDYILQEEDTSQFHMEATVKYYLQERSKVENHPDKPTLWPGPNSNDRFDIKYTKTFNKQLPISRSRAFQAQYPSAKNLALQQFLFCGILFHHWSELAKRPAGANAKCLRGHWLNQSEFIALAKQKHYTFALLPKLAWLGGLNEQTASFLAAPEESVLNTERAVCFERFKTALEQKEYLGRLMVVPDYWPSALSRR